MDRKELIGWFDRLNPYTGRMIDRGGVEAVKDFFRNIFRGKRA